MVRVRCGNTGFSTANTRRGDYGTGDEGRDRRTPRARKHRGSVGIGEDEEKVGWGQGRRMSTRELKKKSCCRGAVLHKELHYDAMGRRGGGEGATGTTLVAAEPMEHNSRLLPLPHRPKSSGCIVCQQPQAYRARLYSAVAQAAAVRQKRAE